MDFEERLRLQKLIDLTPMNMSFANGLNAPIFQFIFERLINFHLAQVIHSIEVFDVINKLGEGLSIPIENEAITLILEKSIIKGKNIILVVECPSQEWVSHILQDIPAEFDIDTFHAQFDGVFHLAWIELLRFTLSWHGTNIYCRLDSWHGTIIFWSLDIWTSFILNSILVLIVLTLLSDILFGFLLDELDLWLYFLLVICRLVNDIL